MSQHVVNAIVLGGIYTLFALGFSLAWGVLRILNLAYGVVATMAALAAWQLTRERPITIVILLPIVVVGAGVLNMVIDRLAFRRLRKDGDGLDLRVLLASVGVVAVLITFAERVTKLDTYSLPSGVFPDRTIELMGLRLKLLELVIIAISLLGTGALTWWIRKTRNGRALRAIAVDPETASLMGINKERLTMITMFVSGALAGLAGLLIAIRFHVVHAYMGDPLMLIAIAAIIIGGVGSIQGAILGGFLLAFLETFTVANGYSSYANVVVFACVIVVLIAKPTGIFGTQTVERQ